MVKIGTVKGYRESDHTARIELQPEGVVTDWLRVAAPTAHAGWGFRAPLLPGEEVVVLCPEGSIVQAVVVAGLYGAQAAVPDTDAGSIHLEHESGARVELAADGRVLVNGGEYGVARFEKLLAKFNTHIHSNGAGATTPPQTPLDDDDAAAKTKVD